MLAVSLFFFLSFLYLQFLYKVKTLHRRVQVVRLTSQKGGSNSNLGELEEIDAWEGVQDGRLVHA
jgi:hypothetical protein